MKLIHEINRPGMLHVGFSVDVLMFRAIASGQLRLNLLRMQIQHDRGFHFAGMAEPARLRLPDALESLRRERPIRGEDELCFREITLEFAQRGARGNVVSSVAIEDKNLFGTQVYNGMA